MLFGETRAFGYSSEDVQMVIESMASQGKEPTFCMGDDIPLAALSQKPHMLFDYFKQRFAQVSETIFLQIILEFSRLGIWYSLCNGACLVLYERMMVLVGCIQNACAHVYMIQTKSACFVDAAQEFV